MEHSPLASKSSKTRNRQRREERQKVSEDLNRTRTRRSLDNGRGDFLISAFTLAERALGLMARRVGRERWRKKKKLLDSTRLGLSKRVRRNEARGESLPPANRGKDRVLGQDYHRHW